MKQYKVTQEVRTEQRTRARLLRLGRKMVKRNAGYASQVGWIEEDGMTPIPYSLSLEDVVRHAHDVWAESEVESLSNADDSGSNGLKVKYLSSGEAERVKIGRVVVSNGEPKRSSIVRIV